MNFVSCQLGASVTDTIKSNIAKTSAFSTAPGEQRCSLNDIDSGSETVLVDH